MSAHRERLTELIEAVIAEGGSDIHLSAGSHPTIRVAGSLVPLLKYPRLSAEDTMGLASALLSEEQRARFLESQEIDFSYAYADKARFRGNGFFERGAAAVALRLIPRKIRTLEELNLPPILKSFTEREQGFFLVVGPVGQGKSTTLAALIELINAERTEHIVTIEDPIEFVYPDAKSIISQREVGTDCESYSLGLRDALRQSPDVILIGEIRDEESAAAAVHFAETGHLVLSTLHASNASQTLERLLHFFPAARHDGVALQLSLNLIGIIAQRLVPLKAGTGQIVAVEVMLATPRVRELLRKADLAGIRSVMQSPAGVQEGMQTFDAAIFQLIKQGLIDEEAGFEAADSPNDLRMRLKGLL